MKRSVVVGALGTAQTLAWGSSYYLPAILADPIAHGLGVSRTTVFGLFSGALLLSAVLGPAVGRAIDNRGGRGVPALSNLVLAGGLVLQRALGTAARHSNDSQAIVQRRGPDHLWQSAIEGQYRNRKRLPDRSPALADMAN